ncbi:glutathione S-transferase family protein [Candidatus Phycosocius spiralis]|uniref:Glutathione S-transferase n=1 Tax=Candidatus Phycosocius spiralis TaxID=2815099 RepID=A0ABQ4PWA3_9PROT|nr:glutathione S-transferase family protein [Candidatus Phycosocius spiralis]GIU67251.1 glutathione S-transferase [Candidatus Phycosocius spiralis]
MPYTLFYSPSTASFVIHWLLIHLGVPFETVLVDFEKGAQKGADYLALNPAGRVPTLMVDGKPYSECTALTMLLAERHPDAYLSPAPTAPERANYLMWMVLLANGLLPPFRDWFYADRDSGALDPQALKEFVRPRIEAMFNRLDAQLNDGRPYLIGAKLTAVDFLATMLMRWSRNMPKPATTWTFIAPYVQRMRALDSFLEVNRREGLVDWLNP